MTRSAFSRRGLLAFALAAASTISIQAACAPLNEEMSRLARESGCALCHSERPATPRAGDVLPPAPAWSDIEARYKGEKDAEVRLVAIVMRGSGTARQERHWAGKTGTWIMPANPVEISETDARRLVRWILR